MPQTCVECCSFELGSRKMDCCTGTLGNYLLHGLIQGFIAVIATTIRDAIIKASLDLENCLGVLMEF